MIESRLKQLGGVCLVLGALSCYMASQFFPWRMLGFSSLFLSVVAVIAFSALYRDKKQSFVYVAV